MGKSDSNNRFPLVSYKNNRLITRSLGLTGKFSCDCIEQDNGSYKNYDLYYTALDETKICVASSKWLGGSGYQQTTIYNQQLFSELQGEVPAPQKVRDDTKERG
jgi:hypothetical protein